MNYASRRIRRSLRILEFVTVGEAVREGCLGVVEVNQITKNLISRELLGGHIVHIVMNCVTRLIQPQKQDKFGLDQASIFLCTGDPYYVLYTALLIS